MTTEAFTVGPVLSFRGSREGRWGVSALIGLARDEPAPEWQVDGQVCPPPLQLLDAVGTRYWRYDLSTSLRENERKVTFGRTHGAATWQFTVPARGQAPRMAYVSCNGFSSVAAMRKLAKPHSAMWSDLVGNHDRSLRNAEFRLDKEQLWHESRTQDRGLQRFHLLMMGGDQLYFDSIWEDIPELKEWVGLSRARQLDFVVSPDLDQTIADYFFSLYATRWLPARRRPWGPGPANGDAADAMARIPTIMMWDDHDIFDGWGSYSEPMQQCALFKTLFQHARRAFWVFQMQHAIAHLPPLQEIRTPGLTRKDPLFQPIAWRRHQDKDPLALPVLDQQPSFTFAHRIGPLAIIAADLRSERSRTQILGSASWERMQAWLDALPVNGQHAEDSCQHLLFLSSVPVMHPKLSLAEGFLGTFGQDHVLDSVTDDIRDHWTHDDHAGERKRLLESLFRTAEDKGLRVSIVSGDVHVAASARSYRNAASSNADTDIHQLTASAVVHPSLAGIGERIFLATLNNSARTRQGIDGQLNVEMLLFPGHNRFIMAARNWLALELDEASAHPTGQLWATWRCESVEGLSNHLLAIPAMIRPSG